MSLTALEINRRGVELFHENRLVEAIAAYREALPLDPTAPYLYNNLALALYCYGDLEEAIHYCQQALACDPDNLNARSNLLYYLHYRDQDPRFVFEQHLEYGRRVGPGEETPFHNTPEPRRPLRLAYLSPDFCAHAVSYFIEPVLRSHDRKHFQLFAYANVPTQDLVTLRFQGYFDHWRPIPDLPDDQVARMLREDRIDILVDLAGHTNLNRLPLLARRQAPVQISWLGYFDTTGLETIDYLLTDPVSSPPGDPQPFAETLLRLPHARMCYQPPDFAPAVAPSPRNSAPFTFGCFNNFAKISPEVLELWARILKGTPGSRLFLKSASAGNEDVQARLRAFFASRGVAPERLILRGLSPILSLLEQYAEVDVALDPFPFTGGLTTCEALWQGVPVLTLRGKSMIARQSAAFLTAVGLEDWIADSVEEYEKKAIHAVFDTSLAALRQSLRARMSESPLCDPLPFTRALEALYRKAWRAWCREARPSLLDRFLS